MLARIGLPTVRGVRWLGALLWLLWSLRLPSVVFADTSSRAPLLPALASGVPCGLIGDCARFDALGVHVGSTLGIAQSPSRTLLLPGRARVSVSLLDALDVSVSLGAQHDRAQQDASLSAQPLSLGVQQLAELVKRKEQKTGKPCFLRGGILHAVSDASLGTMVAFDDQGSGASLLGYELARMIFCDAEPLAGGVPSPLSLLGKGLRGSRSMAGEKVHDVIEHDRPTAPSAPTKPSPGTAATKAEAASEAGSILTDPNRKHIFKGEISEKRAKATGWHFEPTGSKEKGTYVIEETRSPADPHGVYAGNVVIGGVKKKDRSTFFPKDWTEKQVESAIEEAYKNRSPRQRGGEYRGRTTGGMDITLRLDGKGNLESAYPVYKGPKYQGPKQ